MLNSKLETLNPKQIQNSKPKTQRFCFEFLDFGFRVCLEFSV
jgi:hypothetical protein